MKKCERCNKIILIGRLCKNCLQNCDMNIRMAPLAQKIYMEEFDKDNMIVCHYANIIDSYMMSLKKMYDDMEYLPKYKSQITPNNYKDAEKICRAKLKNKIDAIKKEKIKPLAKTGEVKYFTAIVGLEEDIKDTIKLFPQFREELDYSDLEKIIDKYGG